ncbi:MAG: hypothetical protein WEB88_12855, partial [Gemmatimonadota bacterium]
EMRTSMHRRSFLLHGAAALSAGTTIGYAKLDRFEPAAVRRVRVTIEDAVAPPERLGIRVY